MLRTPRNLLATTQNDQLPTGPGESARSRLSRTAPHVISQTPAKEERTPTAGWQPKPAAPYRDALSSSRQAFRRRRNTVMALSALADSAGIWSRT